MPKVQQKSRSYTKEQLKKAVQKILNDNVSIRSVALKFNIPRMTLQRYLQKAKTIKEVKCEPRQEQGRVFQEVDEILLRDFFLYASKSNVGLSIKEGRRFVYEYAVVKNLQISAKWKLQKMAPYDWFYCFMKRQNLGLQTPKKASQISLNKNVNSFFENLRELLERYQIKARDVYRKNGINVSGKSFKVITQKVH